MALMIRRRFRFWQVPEVLLLVLVSSLPAVATNSLVVMTYNLRYASATPPNSWPVRRPPMCELIKATAPDVIGTQEGLYHQLKDLAADLPEFEWIGLGRDGGSKGEFMAVFYRKQRLEPLEFNHFWLSDTPEVIGSSTWGNSNRRMLTWVKFRDLTCGREFYCFNTHFDHQVQNARERSARLVRERIEALHTELPVLLIGDFNAVAGSNSAYTTMTENGFLSDAWLATTNRVGEGLGTFNDFKTIPRDGKRIDWILFRGPVEVLSASINSFSRDRQFPSDHLPVTAVVRWSEPRKDRK